MRLLDFFIRISLQGGRTAAQLRQITLAAEKARKGLDNTGKAVERLNKRTRQSQGGFAQLLRSFRIGGGTRIGQGGFMGAEFAPGRLMGALTKLPPPLMALAVAAGAAAIAVGALAELDKKRAAQAIGIGAATVGATREQMGRLEDQQRNGLFKAGSRGQNILSSVGMVAIADMQGQLLKAGISIDEVLNGKLITALATLRAAEPDVPIENLIQAVANAGPVAEATGGSFEDAAYALSALASGTKFSMQQVSTAMATVAPQAKSMGLTIAELTQLMVLGQEGFSSAAREATGLRSVLSKLNFGPQTKAVKAVEAQHKIDYLKDGKAKNIFDIRDMLLGLQDQLTPAQFEQYLTQRFQKEGKQFWLAFLAQTPEAIQKAKEVSLRGENSANIAAEVTNDTASAKVEELKNKGMKFLEALREAGLGTLFNLIVDGLGLVLDALTIAVNAIGFFTRPIIDVLDGIIRTIFEFVGWLGKNIYDLLPKAGKDMIDGLKRPSKGIAAAPVTAGTKDEQTAASAKTAAQAKQTQDAVLAQSAEVKAASDQAQAYVKTFIPLLDAARAFSRAMPLFVKAARLGVVLELQQMLRMIDQLASQFNVAGQSLGMQFSSGLQLGFGGVAPAAPSVTDNRQFNFNGNGDAYLKRQATVVARGEVSGGSHRRNSRR